MDYAGGESKAFLVRADGSDLRQIERTGEWASWVIWSADSKSVYVSGGTEAGSKYTIWRANADGSHLEKFLNESCGAVDAAPDGKYLLGMLMRGKEVGIYQISIADKKVTPLLPGVENVGARFARDGKSFLYPVVSRNEVTFYRQSWSDGRLLGKPQIALKLPFTFSLYYQGNACDFSCDLATIVYARPGGQADLYLLSPK